MQLAAEIVAAGAFEHRGLMPPVALRAFDLSEMGIVGIDFEAVCLLGKFFVASAVAGQTFSFLTGAGCAASAWQDSHFNPRAIWRSARFWTAAGDSPAAMAAAARNPSASITIVLFIVLS